MHVRSGVWMSFKDVLFFSSKKVRLERTAPVLSHVCGWWQLDNHPGGFSDKVTSQKPWLPQVKECDGKCFFKFEKFDRQVVMTLTGKGLELRSSKEPHLLNSEAYDAIVKLRNDACAEAYIKMMKDAAAAAGDKWEQGKSCPTDDHRYTVSQTVDIMLPEIKRDDEVAGPQKVPCCRNICVKQIVWLLL